eukprot:6177077-Pleurochrysis_carterae.AAC.1
MRPRRHSRQRRNVGGDVGRRDNGVSRGPRLPRMLDGCQWCRISSRTGSGKLRCHRDDGKVRRREAERGANAKQRRSRGQQSARHEGTRADPLPQRIREGQKAAQVAEECLQR